MTKLNSIQYIDTEGDFICK